MNKEKNFMSAIIYVHNNCDTIGWFLKNIIRLLETNFEHSEIICVNDASEDNSVEKIRDASKSAESTAISILNMSYFHGVEIAMNAGVDLSIGDFVLEIDTTNQDYEIDEIMRVYREVLKGNDIVSASPRKKQRMSSSLFYWAFDRFTNDNEKMRSETFRILSRRAINRVNSMSKTVPYRKGLYANCGLKTCNIQYDVVGNGASNKQTRQEKKYRNNLAINTLLLFTNAGYAFSKFVSGFMMGISVFMIVYTVAIYCMSKPIEGWTTTVLFLAVAFWGLFVILTIIIKYLQILLELTFKRAKYSFESIEKLTK